MNKEPRPEWIKALGVFQVIVMELVSWVALGGGLGWLAVKYTNLGAWIYFPTIAVGFCVGMFRVFQVSKKL